jgi:DMSO reductase anchor subunit
MTARYGFFVDPKALAVISSLCWASCLARGLFYGLHMTAGMAIAG